MAQDNTPLAPGERKAAIIELLGLLDIWLDGTDAGSIEIEYKGREVNVRPRPVIRKVIKTQ